VIDFTRDSGVKSISVYMGVFGVVRYLEEHRHTHGPQTDSENTFFIKMMFFFVINLFVILLTSINALECGDDVDDLRDVCDT